MTATATFVDFYDILGITETASDKEILKALKDQRQVWNKRQGTHDLAKRQQAEKRVHDLTQAEYVLLNPQRRQAFNNDRRNTRPDSSPTAADGSGDWIERARNFFGLGQMASANFAAREAIRTQGGSDEAWSIRAQSALNLGDWREAEFCFQEAIRLKPDDPEYHFDLGCAFEAMNESRRALGKFEDALRIDPRNPVYKAAIASIYLERGETARARRIIEEVVRDHPDVEAFQIYLAWAIVDGFEDYATILSDNTFMLTSPAQIARMRSEMNRAKGLKFDDAELRTAIDQRLQLAAKSEQVIWRKPSWFSTTGKAWLVLFAIGLLTIPAYGVGIVIFGLALLAYVKSYKMPKWRADEKELKATRRVKKWGLPSGA